MLKKLWLVVALFCIFSLQGSFAKAEGEVVDTAGSTLTIIPVTVESASFFQTGDQLHFVTMLRNESSRDLVVRSGVEFHPVVKEFAASQAVHTEGAPTVLAIPAGQTVKQEFSVLTPDVPVGQYRIYMGVAEDTKTRTVVKKSIATLELGSEHSVALTDCKMGEQSLADGILEVSPKNARLSGEITCQVALSGEEQSGHMLVRLHDRQYVAGVEIAKVAVNFSSQSQSVTLPFDIEAEPGSYDVEVLPVNTDGRVIGVAVKTRLAIAGIDGSVPTQTTQTTQTTLTQPEQPFNWWMIFWLLPVVFVVFWLAARRVRQARITGIKTLLYLFLFLGASFGVTSQVYAGGTGFTFFYICGTGACPNATSVWYSFSTDKDVFAPGEIIYVSLHISSDDNPQAPLSPYVSVGINGGGYSGDLIPTTYQPQDFRTGVDIYGGVAVAPATPGPFNLSISAGLSGYGTPGVQNIPLTVSVPTPPPTVTLDPFSPSTITAGQSSSISFSSTDATSCTGSGLWNGNVGTSNSGVSTGAMAAGTYVQQVGCTGPGGVVASVTRTLTVNPAPPVSATFTGTPSCVIAANQAGCNTTVGWTAANVSTIVLTDCRSASLPSSDRLLTTISNSGSGSYSPVYVPYKRGCYRIHNNDVNGPILAETTINSSCTAGTSWFGLVDVNGDPTQPGFCQGAAPSAIITATGPVAFDNDGFWKKAISFLTGRDHVVQASGPEEIITVGENVRIDWSSTDASTCAVTKNGSFGVISNQLTGSQRITGLTNTPQSTHTYTITCQKAGFADAVDSVTIRVNPVRADGVCSATHYNCEPGLSRQDGDTSTEYLWTCMGIGGGTNSSQCVESKGGGGGPSTPNYATFTATPSSCGTGTISLNWAAVSGATSYQVQDGGSQIYSGGATSYSHTGLAAGSGHSYTVRATNSNGSSSWTSARVVNAPSACASASTITATAGSGGFISPAGSVSVSAGASQRFDITESFPYVVSNVVVDGFSVGPVRSYTFSNVMSNHTISVSFVLSSVSGITQATSCVISSGRSTCNGRLSWNSPGNNPFISVNGTTFESWASSATNQSVVLDFGDHRVTRRDDDGMDYATMSAICSGSLFYTAGICQVNGGTISVSPSRCDIPVGQSTCDVSLSWSTTGATAPNVYNSTTGVTYSIASSGTSQLYPITFGTNRIRLRNNVTTWDSVSPQGRCLAPGVWNPTTSVCESAVTPCASGVAKSWTVSGTTCDGTTPATNSGQNGTVDDITDPTTGSAQYLCTNGVWAVSPQPGATCVPSPARVDICPASATVEVGGTQSFTAYHTLQGVVFDGCAGTSVRNNVTASTTWGSTDVSVVTVSGGIATGQAIGSASVTATYSGLNATNVPITIIAACSPRACSDDAQSGSTCVGDTFTMDDGCGNTSMSCSGTRSCDYNWKEVAP